jgi:hypothetical protein
MPMPKLKPYLKSKPAVGDLVVVNTAPDSIIYTIHKLKDDDLIAALQYYSGNQMVGGGELPVACLMSPSKTQLLNGKAFIKPVNQPMPLDVREAILQAVNDYQKKVCEPKGQKLVMVVELIADGSSTGDFIIAGAYGPGHHGKVINTHYFLKDPCGSERASIGRERNYVLEKVLSDYHHVLVCWGDWEDGKLMVCDN